MESSWRNQDVTAQKFQSNNSTNQGISENWRSRSEPFVPGNNHGFYDNWNYRIRDQPQQHVLRAKFENSWRSDSSSKGYQGKQRASCGFEKTRQAPLSLNVHFLGTMNNYLDSAQFVEGLGQIGTLNTLSQNFPPGNPARVSVYPAQHKDSYVISQTSEVQIRVQKVTEELEGNERELLEVQGHCVEPTHTFFQKNRSTLRKFGINLVTNRGLLKGLMVPRKPSHIVVRKTENNVLYVCDAHPREQDGVDTATGITFEEYLCRDGQDTWEPIKRTYGIYQVTIGESSILYHAEIDALKTDSQILRNSSAPISPEDFVEVKTISSNKVNHRGDVTTSLAASGRLRDWWAQCSLAGIQHLVCGILNGKHSPYGFDTDFIELLKMMELNVTKFPSECTTEAAEFENETWSENSLTQQLDTALNLIRERFSRPDIEVGRKYAVTVATSRERYTGRRIPFLRDFRLFSYDERPTTSGFSKY